MPEAATRLNRKDCEISNNYRTSNAIAAALNALYTKQDFELAIDLLDRRRIDPAAMVTNVVGFGAFADAFQALKTPSTQCKVLLEPIQTGDGI